jgi:hypothetical protein
VDKALGAVANDMLVVEECDDVSGVDVPCDSVLLSAAA